MSDQLNPDPLAPTDAERLVRELLPLGFTQEWRVHRETDIRATADGDEYTVAKFWSSTFAPCLIIAVANCKKVVALHNAAPALLATLDALRAEVGRLRAENQRLDQLVCDFQAASMIDVGNQGGPCRVEPRHVEQHVTALHSENDALRAEVGRLKAIIAQHDLCHDLHGKVDARAFADGCAAEQRKLYGCAPDPLAPTDADMARDASADLAVCDAATPGPWTDDDGYRVRAGPHDELCIVEVKHLDGTGFDSHFIATARTALPAWIRRAVAAEAERDALRAEVARLKEGKEN